MEWLAVVLAAVISVAGGALTLYLGSRVDKAHGLPSDFEERLRKEKKEYEDALEKRNGQLELDVKALQEDRAKCMERLEEAELREAGILRRLDDVEIQNARLLARLGPGA